MEQKKLSILAADIQKQQELIEAVFRHAYGFELEADKIKIVLKKALALKKLYQKDIAYFLAQLKTKTKTRRR